MKEPPRQSSLAATVALPGWTDEGKRQKLCRLRLRGDAATLVAALNREWRLHLRRADVAGAVGNAQPRLPARARRLQGERGGGRLAHRDFLPGPAGLADFQAQRR